MKSMSTLPPALDMERYFFSDVQIKANLGLSEEDINSGKAFNYDFSAKIDILGNDDDKTVYMVKLSLTNDNTTDSRAYDIHLTVAGVFRFPENAPEDKINKLLQVLAPSILYGAARDFLLTITSRGPYPAAYLPTISFVPEEKRKAKATSSKTKKALPVSGSK
jgi:preprotein translocase subunit SecB